MKEMSDDLSHKFNDLVESYQQKKDCQSRSIFKILQFEIFQYTGDSKRNH